MSNTVPDLLIISLGGLMLVLYAARLVPPEGAIIVLLQAILVAVINTQYIRS